MTHFTLRRAHGFTLIELLIAVTIGLLLTVTIAQLFLGSRKSYATTDDVSRMQENMRYASDILARTIRMAGYMSSPSTYQVDTDGVPGMFSGLNAALVGVDGNGGSSLTTVDQPDTITVRMQGTADLATVDCSGVVVPANTVSTSIFSIAVDTTTNSPSLMCQTAFGGPAIPLVNDVENMQILYGEEKNGDFSADTNVPANLVTDMNRVVSVRIALLFRTANMQVRSSPDTTQYQMHGGKLAAFASPENTRIRRVMTFTIALRNRTP